MKNKILFTVVGVQEVTERLTSNKQPPPPHLPTHLPPQMGQSKCKEVKNEII